MHLSVSQVPPFLFFHDLPFASSGLTVSRDIVIVSVCIFLHWFYVLFVQYLQWIYVEGPQSFQDFLELRVVNGYVFDICHLVCPYSASQIIYLVAKTSDLLVEIFIFFWGSSLRVELDEL